MQRGLNLNSAERSQAGSGQFVRPGSGLEIQLQSRQGDVRRSGNHGLGQMLISYCAFSFAPVALVNMGIGLNQEIGKFSAANIADEALKPSPITPRAFV